MGDQVISARRSLDGTAGDFLFKSKTYERKSAADLFTAANIGLPIEREREHRQRRASEHALQACQVFPASLQRGIDFVRHPAGEFRSICFNGPLRQYRVIQASQAQPHDQ